MSRIIEMRIENVKRIALVEFSPEGNMVVIGGRNEQGKSSCLDAIQYCLTNARTHCRQPIRNGSDKGEITIKLSADESRGLKPLEVRRIFTASGSRLTVTADGVKLGSPQKILDELFSHLSFDPCAFMRKPPREQVDILKQIAGLDFADLDDKRQRVYDQRADINRRAAQLEGAISEMPVPDGDVPDEEVSIKSLMEDLSAADAANDTAEATVRRVDDARKELQQAGERLSDAELQVERLKKQLAEAEARVEKCQQTKSEATTAVAAAMDDADYDLIDTSPIKQRIADAEGLNAQVRAKRKRELTREEYEGLLSDSAEMTGEIQAIDDGKRQRVVEASFPIDGLSIDDESVLYRDVPLDQASQAQSLQVSVAIGAALNPACPIMLIRDGSWLDDEHLAELGRIAAQRELQVFVERVGNSDQCAVILEDGKILQREPQTAAEPAAST